MKRWIVSLGMLALLVTPVSGQEVVIGNFDGAAGECDGPGTTCTAGTGAIHVFGWALAATGVQKVVIQVDGRDFGQAIYGVPRPDVTAMFPGFPDSALPGWFYNLDSTQFQNGDHRVSAKVVTFGGTSTVIGGAQDIGFTNNTAILVPFGRIDLPSRNADLYGSCDRPVCGDTICEIGKGESCISCLFDCAGVQEGLGADFCCGGGEGVNPVGCEDPQCSPAGFTCDETETIRYSVVRGWALDLGVEIGDAGIGWVELLINGAIFGNTRSGCFFDTATGGLTDCYGLPRLDVERLFPFAIDAPTSGFRFVLDVGALIDFGFPRGSNTLTIRSGDISNQNANVDEFPVNFLCEEEVLEASFGRIESPRAGRVYAGLLTFQGWALDGEGVDRVEVYVDGELVPGTLYGPGLGTRTLVASDYPGFQDTEAPVWRLTDYDTTQISDGFHQLQAAVIDTNGDLTFIGEVTFRVDNVAD